ncbi:MAG: hypothetical protein ACRCSP_08040 [Rhodoglobus sp.]
MKSMFLASGLKNLASKRASSPFLRNFTWVRPAVMVLGALMVFAAHFRPWEMGLLEEWALARDWQLTGGWRVLFAYVEWTVSRPLHLLPTMLGLAIVGGSPTGIFVIMGMVAVLQFFSVLWALRSASRSFWVNIAVGLFFALHPLWPAGFLQRFLPAQTAALALVIALGLIIRWLQQGRARWLVGTCVVLLLGFAVYPGPAVVAPLMALTVALVIPSSWRRRIAVVVAAIVSTSVMALYSIVIVRLVTPTGTNSYELANIQVAVVKSARELVHYIAGTFINSGTLLVLGLLAIIVLGAILSLTKTVPNSAGWLMAGVAIISPMCAVVFFGSIAWLQDIDRIGYTTSLALVVALAIWPITTRDHPTRLEAIFVILLVVVAVAGCLIGISRWQTYVQTQHRLLGALSAAVEEAKGEEAVIVVDHSGTFGYLYTFPLQYLQGASIIFHEDPTKVWLCFPESSAYPLPSGGVTCDPSSKGLNLRPEGSLALDRGAVEFYIGRVDTNDFETKEFK